LDGEIKLYIDQFSLIVDIIKKFKMNEENICKKGEEYLIAKDYDINLTLDSFQEIINSIKEKNTIICSDEKLIIMNNIFIYCKNILDKIDLQMVDYSDKFSQQEKYIDDKSKIIKPLEQREILLKSRDDILKYVKQSAQIKKASEVIDELSQVIRIISSLKTSYFDQVFIGKFKAILDKEYDHLNFTKPFKYELSTRTEKGENKRVYKVGDMRIRDILSEGELKQHALADFFALIELEDYRGVVILDDPVTSLDLCNIECLTERIIKLINEKQNQVIIFTHNILFLNYLLTKTVGVDSKMHHCIKSSSTIFIETNINFNDDADYNARIKEIDKRISLLEEKNQKGDNIDNFEIGNVYDLLSGFLECFVEYKILKNVINRYRSNIRMESLPKIKWDEGKIAETMRLFHKTSRKGTRHSQPKEEPKPTLSDLLEDKRALDALIEKSTPR
jgi:energy-coupling factor transporter ATP-binding protein EcfA2